MRSALFAGLLVTALGAAACGLPEISDAESGCFYASDAGPLCPRPADAGAADASSDARAPGDASSDGDAGPSR